MEIEPENQVILDKIISTLSLIDGFKIVYKKASIQLKVKVVFCAFGFRNNQHSMFVDYYGKEGIETDGTELLGKKNDKYLYREYLDKKYRNFDRLVDNLKISLKIAST